MMTDKNSKKDFVLNQDTGLFEGVLFIPSPNSNMRPKDIGIDLLVIHNISFPPGQFGGEAIKELFCNTLDLNAHPTYKTLVGVEVSAHLLIRRDGELIQFVPFHLRAWHAGISSFEGRTGCNDFSIGIELEGTDNIPYTSEQYDVLSQIALSIMKAFPEITLERIVGHNQIAPDRKTDPGAAFDWTLFYNLVQKEIVDETDHSPNMSSLAELP